MKYEIEEKPCGGQDIKAEVKFRVDITWLLGKSKQIASTKYFAFLK